MSKIQDAIRKLQSSQTNTRPAEREQTLGTIVREPRSERQADSLDSGVFVDIDKGLLRDAGLLAPTEQHSQIADQYRIIKRPLLDNAAGKGAYQAHDANMIMVTSALAGDGKTFNCINLALSMAAEKDKTVLLVDADVGKPHISNHFGLENRPGLIDLLTDNCRDVSELILKTSVSQLTLLPAGRYDEHATELLASRRMASIIDKLSMTYRDRIVIFDSPPLLVTSEARVLASSMGQIVLIVCAGSTPQDAVTTAIESLGPDKAISIIMNRSSEGFGSYRYGGYGYGYGNRAGGHK